MVSIIELELSGNYRNSSERHNRIRWGIFNSYYLENNKDSSAYRFYHSSSGKPMRVLDKKKAFLRELEIFKANIEACDMNDENVKSAKLRELQAMYDLGHMTLFGNKYAKGKYGAEMKDVKDKIMDLGKEFRKISSGGGLERVVDNMHEVDNKINSEMPRRVEKKVDYLLTADMNYDFGKILKLTTEAQRLRDERDKRQGEYYEISIFPIVKKVAYAAAAAIGLLITPFLRH